MASKKIMYVCETCEENNPEGCGRFNRADVRIAANGRWLCNECYDDDDTTDENSPAWHDLPEAPEYTPVTSVGDLESLVAACEAVFCSDSTEKTTGKSGDEMQPCADEDAVMAGEAGDDMRLTFGMIRRARSALTAADRR